MSQGRGVRDALKSIVPAWLADRAAGLNKGFKVLWTIALMADGIVETSLEGVRAALPGVGTATALSLIGASRRIIRGLGESDDAYAARLRGWLDLWTQAASDETTIQLIQTFLGPEPSVGQQLATVQIMNRAGLFTRVDENGVITQTIDTDWTIPGLDWDTIYNPERAQWWSDIWLVVYVSAFRWTRYTDLTDPTWVAAWGAGTLGLGHPVPREAYQGVMNILADMKGAHTFVEAVIITTDTDLFAPGTFGSPDNPNGRWGNFSAPNVTTRIQEGVRNMASAFGSKFTRYWAPVGGG